MQNIEIQDDKLSSFANLFMPTIKICFYTCLNGVGGTRMKKLSNDDAITTT